MKRKGDVMYTITVVVRKRKEVSTEEFGKKSMGQCIDRCHR
jgi:hypothetical protein